ncbi:MAG: PhnD/SsuA/transferrin family substrate-binding protein [Planctomycetota bacterium]
MPQLLRYISYLSPGIPQALFQTIIDYLAEALETPTELRIDGSTSGPRPECNPLESGEAEFAWLCTPSYLWSLASDPLPVVLVPASMVFSDPRNNGRPYYHSDVVVHRDSSVRCFGQLRDGRWSYNDNSSQSGYYNVLEQLAEMDAPLTFFASMTASGSHLESLRRVAAGDTDAAAIDSNVLASYLATHPELARSVRVLTTWGPHAVQPLVAAPHVAPAVIADVAVALRDMHTTEYGEALARFGVTKFVTVDQEFYSAEAASVKAGESVISCQESLEDRCRRRPRDPAWTTSETSPRDATRGRARSAR